MMTDRNNTHFLKSIHSLICLVAKMQNYDLMGMKNIKLHNIIWLKLFFLSLIIKRSRTDRLNKFQYQSCNIGLYKLDGNQFSFVALILYNNLWYCKVCNAYVLDEIQRRRMYTLLYSITGILLRDNTHVCAGKLRRVPR